MSAALKEWVNREGPFEVHELEHLASDAVASLSLSIEAGLHGELFAPDADDLRDGCFHVELSGELGHGPLALKLRGTMGVTLLPNAPRMLRAFLFLYAGDNRLAPKLLAHERTIDGEYTELEFTSAGWVSRGWFAGALGEFDDYAFFEGRE